MARRHGDPCPDSRLTNPLFDKLFSRHQGSTRPFLYLPDGAIFTYDNFLAAAGRYANALADLWRYTEKDVLLHALPVFHTHGLFVATNVTLIAGGAMIFFQKFDINGLFAHMSKATVLMGVPTFYTRLLSDKRLTRNATANMRLFISGSVPLLKESHKQFETRTGHRILERYGVTETNMNTSNPFDGARHPGTVGLPLPGVELKVTDPKTREPLPAGASAKLKFVALTSFKATGICQRKRRKYCTRMVLQYRRPRPHRRERIDAVILA